MRIKTTAAIVAFAIVGAIAISVTGQEEALPAVTRRPPDAVIPLAEPTVVLAVEPIRDFRSPTLLDAARSNDYLTFDALYTAAQRRGEDVSPFATLHDLWTYSVTDPIGAFYGRDVYERLSRAYPGYAAYIAEYRIVDSRGQVFYPTSETRSFLVDRIIEGRTPRVVIASKSATAPRASRSTPAPRRRASNPARAASVPATTPAVAQAPVVKQPVPVPVQTPARAPEVAAEVTAPATQPAAVAASPAPVTATPNAAAAPVVAVPAPAAQPQRPLGGRGLVLLFIGLIGAGLLAVILRTPREEPMRIVEPPPVNNVEPMRKPQATAPKPPDTPRATGSHG